MLPGDYLKELSSVILGLSGVVNWCRLTYAGARAAYVLQGLRRLISFASYPLLWILRAECKLAADEAIFGFVFKLGR